MLSFLLHLFWATLIYFKTILIIKISDETTEGAEAEETDKDPKKKKKKRRLSLSHKNTIKNFNSNLCDISKLPSASFSSRTIIDTSNINNLHMNQLYLNRDGYALLLL